MILEMCIHLCINSILEYSKSIIAGASVTQRRPAIFMPVLLLTVVCLTCAKSTLSRGSDRQHFLLVGSLLWPLKNFFKKTPDLFGKKAVYEAE